MERHAVNTFVQKLENSQGKKYVAGANLANTENGDLQINPNDGPPRSSFTTKQKNKMGQRGL